MRTRTATRADLPVLREFEQGIIAAERPFDPTLRPDPISYYDLGELIDSDRAEVVVVLDGDLIVGSGYAKYKGSDPYVAPAEHAFLGFMFVRPEYRGCGVNQLVVAALTEWARQRGFSELRLRVYADNTGAIRAYEKAGFQEHLIEMRRELTLE
ncbi:GNAT family N-acetyltransferase [Neolewinella lacunae]|uniref:GNAT family N-acetyltransferase n=1 Tax=Neolewinella lacunae TaxID=1517758 RepID=A0A923PQ75_9BACT|nr:GNAT family N-acetyltransferase [Neolewinella lacunae]MBC6995776.1 GNAT family N-acetyltransferase [Neolewinella lacunae]MDN3636531.1 GNAT family N-acetyltransferase [Neolewinella lacunae]